MIKNKKSLMKYLNQAERDNIDLADLFIAENAQVMETTAEEVLNNMITMKEVMFASIEHGLSGVKSSSGLSGGLAKKLLADLEAGRLELLGETAQRAYIYAIAVAESNAAMGRIVAAPTAGASGILPGTLKAMEEMQGWDDDKLARALVIAGSIGVVIAERASLSGAMGGCQAECGSGAAMAAGALVYGLGGSPSAIGHAVSMVMKNVLGLVCDPVAGLVEVPCVKRNGSAAMQAFLAAEMALAGVTSFIPVDEAIDAMGEVGRRMPCALRETADGGMAQTPTALAWTKEYFQK